MFENVTKIDFNVQASISRYTFYKPKVVLKVIGFAVFVMGLLYFKNQFVHAVISTSLGLLLMVYIVFLFDKMVNLIVKHDFNKLLYNNGDMFIKYIFEKNYFVCQFYKGEKLIKVSLCKYVNIYKIVDYEKYIFIR